MGNKTKEYILCKLKNDNEGGIIPGKEIERYESSTMLSPGMVISGKNRKYRIRCIDLLTNGDRIAIVE
jgi:hypothetical protein